MILTTDGIKLTSSTNYPFMAYAGQAIAALIHMTMQDPNNYRVTYQRERIVRVSHIGGEFLAIDEDGYIKCICDDPAEFASLCNSIHVERLTGREGTDLLHMEVVGIEEWLKFGSVE